MEEFKGVVFEENELESQLRAISPLLASQDSDSDVGNKIRVF